MTARRLTATLLTVVALAGCGDLEKPTPGVSVFSGSDTIRLEAASYCAEDGSSCEPKPVKLTRLSVAPGDTIGISVDSDIAERGWYLATRNQVISRRIEGHYYKFAVGAEQFSQSDALNLQVVTLPGEQAGSPSGVWAFTLEPARS